MSATAPSQTAAPDQTVRLKIQRQDNPDSTPYWEEFDVPWRTGSNIISCLQWVAANPRTVEGRKTTPVIWDANCLEEVCGACTMRVDGRVRQSCSAIIEDQIKKTGSNTITLQPMAKFPVVRDLFVDRSRLFKDLQRVRGWVPIDGTHDLGAGPRETPDRQDVRYKLSECMSCGCCLDACPQYTRDNHFVGAAVFGQVRYFNLHEVGARTADERLDEMTKPGGINDCGQAQNCVKVCPKEIPLTEAIADVGRQTTLHSIKRFFRG